jgi:hypothetical protein
MQVLVVQEVQEPLHFASTGRVVETLYGKLIAQLTGKGLAGMGVVRAGVLALLVVVMVALVQWVEVVVLLVLISN